MTAPSASNTAALVLIADSFGDNAAPRALGRWGRTTVIEYLADTLAEFFTTIVLVVGCESERVVAETELGDGIVVIDPEWEEGVSSPLRAGLDTLSRLGGVEHVMVIDGATPSIDRSVVSALIEGHAAIPHGRAGRRVGDQAATVGKYRYSRSGPVVLARELWERFLTMEGAAPILQVLSAHPEWVTEVWFDQLPPSEVHDEDDLARIAPRA